MFAKHLPHSRCSANTVSHALESFVYLSYALHYKHPEGRILILFTFFA